MDDLWDTTVWEEIEEINEVELDTSGTECPIPVLKARKLSKKIKFRGRTFKSIRKLAKFYKVSSGTLAGKISRGVSIKKALGL